MLSTDFAYFISFVIFAFLAYRLGFRHAKKAMNDEIERVSATIQRTTEEKDIAFNQLNDLRHQLSEIQKNSQAYIDELQDRGTEITAKHRESLEALLKDREHYHKELLSQEVRLHMNQMKDEMLSYVTQQLTQKIKSNKSFEEGFQKKALEMLKSASTKG